MSLGSGAGTTVKAFVLFPSLRRGLFRFQGIASFLERAFLRLLQFKGEAGRKRHIQSLTSSDSCL